MASALSTRFTSRSSTAWKLVAMFSFAMPIMRLSSWRIWVTYIAEKPMGCSCLEAGIGTRKARCIPSSLSSLRSGRMRMAIFTRYPPKGSSSRVVTILKRVCMLAICAAGLSGSWTA